MGDRVVQFRVIESIYTHGSRHLALRVEDAVREHNPWALLCMKPDERMFVIDVLRGDWREAIIGMYRVDLLTLVEPGLMAGVAQ